MGAEIVLFSSILQNKLEESGLKKQEFAEFLGISNTSLYNYLKGNQIPLAQRFEKICNKLDINDTTKEKLFEELHPKSLTLEEDYLLMDLVSADCNLPNISDIFSENGFNRSQSFISYHRKHMMEVLGLKKSSVTESKLEDTTKKIINQIFRNQRELNAKPIKKRIDTTEYGNVFQEFARLVYMFYEPRKTTIPEYVLSVVKHPDTKEVIHTSNIVDLVLDKRALEIKIGKYDPNKIFEQLKNQKRALQLLKERKDIISNSKIKEVKNIDLVVLEECKETKKLREFLKDDDFFNVRVLEEDLTLLKTSIVKKESDGSEKYLDQNYDLFYDLYSIIKKRKIKGEDLSNLRYLLHVINDYYASQSILNMRSDDYLIQRSKLKEVFSDITKKRKVSIEDVNLILINKLGIPKEKISRTTSYLHCHYEEDGKLKRTRRRFIQAEDNDYKLLSKIWQNMGIEEEFELTNDNLYNILNYQQQELSKRKELKKDFQKKTELSITDFRERVKNLAAESYVGEEAELADFIKDCDVKKGKMLSTYLFFFEKKNRRLSIFPKASFPEFKSMNNKDYLELIGNYYSDKSLFHNIWRIPSLMKISANVAFNRTDIDQDIKPALKQGDVEKAKECINSLEKKIKKNIQKLENYCKSKKGLFEFKKRLDQASGKKGRKRYDYRALITAKRDYFLTTFTNWAFMDHSILTGLRRTKAIAELNPKLAKDYLDLTLGKKYSNEDWRYHRIINITAEDPVYDAINDVYTMVSENGRMEKLSEKVEDINETMSYLVNVYLSNNRGSLIKGFFKYLDKNEDNKVDILLNLEEEDFKNLGYIKGRIKQLKNKDLENIEFGKPIYKQLLR